jgi:coenzyme F420-0:L-glutamate ligase / coenzyme F420-1:gamma-L-glutamate ligase
MTAGRVSAAITARRSVRQFRDDPVDAGAVRELVSLACTAPAPHGSRPWRFVYVSSREARTRLSEAMTNAYRSDLERDGAPVLEIDRQVRRSREQIEGAPALLVACLSLESAPEWPDERRRAAERDMYMQSLGAGLQNLLLAAYERGLAGYLKGAPLFCAPAVRQALEMPDEWQPAFLVLLGYPREGSRSPPRAPTNLSDILVER